jgi:hypothetical protein
MIIYLATPTTILTYDKGITKDAYILETYHAIRKKKDITWIDPAKFILDSGAYTYMRGNGGNIKTINWDTYIHEYAEFVKHYKIRNYFELDIDKIIGYENVKKLTAKLNKLVGHNCIPVWHKSRGIPAWEQMIKENDYISLSASGNNGSSEWTRTPKGEIVMNQLNNMALKHGVKVHALGYTKLKVLDTIKFHSCDSTSWTFSVRSGSVLVFKDGKIERIVKPENTKCNVKKVYTTSYEAWKSLQKHYLNK